LRLRRVVDKGFAVERRQERQSGRGEGRRQVALAERASKAGVSAVVFDRNGYRFHGRIKALADAAREGRSDLLIGPRTTRRHQWNSE
jgi:hypothetical protein